jgi:hypothetical protein
MLFLLLWLCSIVWSWVSWCPQHWTFCSELLWLFNVFCVSICISGLIFLFLWRISLDFFYSFIHMCTYCLGHFSLLSPPHSLCPIPLAPRQNLLCPFFQFFWREDISNDKKDKAFLLVEIRIATQRDS